MLTGPDTYTNRLSFSEATYPYVFLLVGPHSCLETSDVVRSYHTPCPRGKGVDIMIEATADGVTKKAGKGTIAYNTVNKVGT